mmetsp:Transcript_21460/g.47104  ORF Transcript_21460/g.47104 Transcript_21460/m.47104 type:complete len:200 (-) Transcript_21460:264-863(-)
MSGLADAFWVKCSLVGRCFLELVSSTLCRESSQLLVHRIQIHGQMGFDLPGRWVSEYLLAGLLRAWRRPWAVVPSIVRTWPSNCWRSIRPGDHLARRCCPLALWSRVEEPSPPQLMMEGTMAVKAPTVMPSWTKSFKLRTPKSKPICCRKQHVSTSRRLAEAAQGCLSKRMTSGFQIWKTTLTRFWMSWSLGRRRRQLL